MLMGEKDSKLSRGFLMFNIDNVFALFSGKNEVTLLPSESKQKSHQA